MSSFSNSSMAFVEEGRYCRCDNEAKMGGCDYFYWYEDQQPLQANRVMWGLLKKVKAFDEK
ncbi:hypothetical protein H5410_051662 [Solanum commersonii]|uniref:Uncharacterized protein n=1 Tax=Solanum commersonii TaxID=4109 RepID=A0A9J5WZ27_SOLCO|nr:hypothetical protein H5410_051662 [Solanum commersonii]